MVHKDLVKLSASLLIMILASCWESRKSPSEYRSEEHTSELQSHSDLVCRLLLEKKKPKRTLPTYRRNHMAADTRPEFFQPKRCHASDLKRLISRVRAICLQAAGEQQKF